VIALLLLCCACQKAPESPPAKSAQEVQKDEQYRQDIDEIRKNIKGDLRIKLKKDGKGGFYSWEISGKDAHEILKANEVLTKKLGQ